VPFPFTLCKEKKEIFPKNDLKIIAILRNKKVEATNIQYALAILV